MKLALGTVQFGLSYGVANTGGQVSPAGIADILACARANGIDVLDTAVLYGSSEERLGEAGIADFRVVSKLPKLPENPAAITAFVDEAVEGSLKRLRRDSLYALLLHQPTDSQGDRGAALAEAFEALTRRGLVEKTGISIYKPADLDACPFADRLGLMQAPFNVLDRRLETSGWLSRLQANGTEVHTRSVFLQGLLLMAPESRNAYFARWNSLWQDWQDWLSGSGFSALQGAVFGIAGKAGIDRVVVGVDTAAQLDEIAKVFHTAIHPPPVPDFSTTDTDLIDPTFWRLR